MNRIDTLFSKKRENILSIYFTAGFPALNDTVPIIRALENAGAEMIEIGFPFSDPLADGPVIQHSSEIAIKNGMNLQVLFGQISKIRDEVKVPLLLMGYLNPVLQYGVEDFCRDSSACGIDGVIIPDLPVEMYQKDYKKLFEGYNLHFVPLVTPLTTDERIREIDSIGSGFIYVVSSASTTGTKPVSEEILSNLHKRMKGLNIKSHTLIGFGINNRESFARACRYAEGGIIGTAYINAIADTDDIAGETLRFVRSIKA